MDSGLSIAFRNSEINSVFLPIRQKIPIVRTIREEYEVSSEKLRSITYHNNINLNAFFTLI